MANWRRANGRAEPWKVRYFGVGNESWGCGGEMTAGEYSVEFRKFTAWTPRFSLPLSFIASGPNGFDIKWSREFFTRMAEKSPGTLNSVWGWALHYYCGTVGKGDSLDFSPDDAYELLRLADRMEELVESHWNVMGEVDREHKVKLVIDEWGAWHNDHTAVAPHHLFGSVQTMRDALIAGLTLDTFHRHADKIAMANVAQLVNCIQTLFLANEDKFCVTPTYHVFDLYKDHHNGQSVRTQFVAPRIGYSYDGKPQNMVRLAGSASRANGRLTLTAVNLSLTDALATTVAVEGANPADVQAWALTGPDIHAHNNFASPDAVKPKSLETRVAGKAVQVTLPAASVIKIQARLA
jgi:alpha-N-arabinofuranosidase